MENKEVQEVQNETVKKTAKSVKKNILQKLLAIQTVLKAPKDLYNSYGKFYYRNAESILEAVKPFLLEQGCILLLKDEIEVFGSTFYTQTNENGLKEKKEVPRRYVKATARLIDCETGEEIETSAYANECEHTNMSGDQCTGTASSYARKYCLNALFLLDDTKDSDTDEMKNIEKKGDNKPAAPKFQQGGWGKKQESASTRQPASAQPAAQTEREQAPQARGWGKNAQSSSNGWNNR